MRHRKLSSIAVVAVGAAALVGVPASATAAQPVNEVGYLADTCTGEADGYTASVDLYQTSAFGGFAYVGALISTPDDDTLLNTAVPEGDLLFDDGTIDVDLTLVNEETQEAAGTATVSGTYTASGRPTRVHEVINEGEEIVVTVGTNTPLSVDLTLEYDGTTIALECANAFTFDLRVLRQPIGTDE